VRLSISPPAVRHTVERNRKPLLESSEVVQDKTKGELIVKFLSVYKTVETGIPPTQEEMTRMGKLIEEGMKAGTLLAVEGCMPSATGARVRQSNGSVIVTDGPFAETKEVIGGLAILQANSKEHAIELVKQFLGQAGDGECELRQLYEASCAEQNAQSQAVAKA
jgi:hypothetical protein